MSVYEEGVKEREHVRVAPAAWRMACTAGFIEVLTMHRKKGSAAIAPVVLALVLAVLAVVVLALAVLVLLVLVLVLVVLAVRVITHTHNSQSAVTASTRIIGV